MGPPKYRIGELWEVKGLRSKRIGSSLMKAIVEINLSQTFGPGVKILVANFDMKNIPMLTLNLEVFMRCWGKKRLLSDKEAKKWRVLKNL